MVVQTSFESIDYRVFKTESFTFRMKLDTLNKLKEKKNFLKEIRKRLERGMRPIIDNVTGVEWQQSADSIFEILINENQN